MASKNINKCFLEKQVLVLVSTRTVKRICNVISAEKSTFQPENVLLCYESNGQCLACVHPIRDALGYMGEHLSPGQTDSQVVASSGKLNLRRYLRWVAKR